jgi:phosphatidylglycerol:prolipoprotein diacylglycerol transferase
MNQVSFPGIGIGTFGLDNVAFCIGDRFCVYWYGVIITCGIIFAFLYTAFRGKYEGVKFDHIVDVGIWTVLLGVVGARLYYVLTSLDNYIPKPFDFIQFIKNIFNLRNGGLAIYGGIICGALAILLVTKIKKINTLKFMDMVAPGVMIGQLMGRWGNFFNGEAYGGLVSEGHPLYFLRMGLVSSNTVGDFGTKDMVFVHPTFLYESLWNLTGFILINALYKKKKFNGQIACMYLAWYGFGRFFIEGLRTDSLYVGPFRISQVVGLVCFVVFGGLLIAGLVYSKKTENSAEMSALARFLKPTIEMNPVIFEKKAKKCENASEKTENNEVEKDKCESAQKEETEKTESIDETEEKENGTDN